MMDIASFWHEGEELIQTGYVGFRSAEQLLTGRTFWTAAASQVSRMAASRASKAGSACFRISSKNSLAHNSALMDLLKLALRLEFELLQTGQQFPLKPSDVDHVEDAEAKHGGRDGPGPRGRTEI